MQTTQASQFLLERTWNYDTSIYAAWAYESRVNATWCLVSGLHVKWPAGSSRAIRRTRFARPVIMVIAPTPSLLITDDDRGFRETLRGVFEPQGFRIHLARDGEEALEIVRTHEVHLVLLDMHMPKLTGLETLRRVKQLHAFLPCILLSAEADEQMVKDALLAQAFSVLAKPVTRLTITTTVRTALRTTYNWSE